jgi:hypothetical protein
MSADLPTLGKPIITARTGRGISPLLRRFAFISTLTSSAALRTCGKLNASVIVIRRNLPHAACIHATRQTHAQAARVLLTSENTMF